MTKEEINLCKQVAKKEWREIERFEKIIHGNHLCTVTKILEHKGFPGSLMGFETSCCSIGFAKKESVIPLWTISDCLKFLRKRCKDHVLLIHEENGDETNEEWYLWFDEYKETQQWDKGKTALEACLKVVLAVLEDAK